MCSVIAIFNMLFGKNHDNCIFSWQWSWHKFYNHTSMVSYTTHLQISVVYPDATWKETALNTEIILLYQWKINVYSLHTYIKIKRVDMCTCTRNINKNYSASSPWFL